MVGVGGGMETLRPEVVETVTTYFLLAWMYDLEDNGVARDYCLTRAFRTLMWEGII